MSLERVLPRLRETRLERAHHAPRNPVARVVQAGERRGEADGAGHQRVVRRLDVIHEYRSRRRCAQRELVADFFRGEPLHALAIYGTYSQKPRRLWDDRRPAFSRMNPRTLPSHLHRAQMMKTSLQAWDAETVN